MLGKVGHLSTTDNDVLINSKNSVLGISINQNVAPAVWEKQEIAQFWGFK